MALPQQGTETPSNNFWDFQTTRDVLMALPQQGTETSEIKRVKEINQKSVLMALPQQGTETFIHCYSIRLKERTCVNGLTPTGDGNNQFLELKFHLFPFVLMALPQQGTETSQTMITELSGSCVNGLTPTGDGNSNRSELSSISKTC